VYSCKSVGITDLEYVIHNKTENDAIILWENPGKSIFDTLELKQDTILKREAKVLALFPVTITRDIGCHARDSLNSISGLSILQIHYIDNDNKAKFYKYNPAKCRYWEKSRLNTYKTFILPLNEIDFK